MYWKRFRKTENNASLVDRHIPVKAPGGIVPAAKKGAVSRSTISSSTSTLSNRR